MTIQQAKMIVGVLWVGAILLMQTFNLGGTPANIQRAVVNVQHIMENNRGR